MRYRKIRKNPFRKDVRSIMIDHVRIEAVMKKLKRSFTMRTVFLAVATVALLTSTAIFMSVGAAGEVTPSDLTADAPSAESGTESEAVVDEPSAYEPEGSGEKVKVTPSDLKADASVSRIVSPSEMLDPVSSDISDLGDPVATMTTAKATGSTISLSITGTDVYIDYGGRTPVPYPGDATVLGSEIKLYGNITSLSCWSNQLTSLDVSGCAALTYLNCYDNQLTALDVSHNTALEVLVFESNQLTTLDVSNNTALTDLWCASNQLTALDVSNNTALTHLDCKGNQLTALNVSKNTALTDLWCDSNQLTALDVSGCTALTGLGCSGNHLTMQTIYGFNADNRLTWFTYAPQTHVIPSTVKAGESIDLSSEASVNGTETVFTWYDQEGNEVTPATSSGGVFTFGDDAVGKKLVCKMTNAKLPDFRTGTDSYEEYDEDGNPTGNTVNYDFDKRLRTTEVTIEAASVSSDPVSSEASDPVDPENPDPVDPENPDPVSSDDGGNNGGNGNNGNNGNNDNNRPRTPYYDLTYKQNDEIDGFRAVQYPEGTIVEINGRKFDLHSIFGIRLNIGHIDKSQRKPILDAIKGYNKSFDPDTNNIIFYEMNLEDSNQAHVNIVKGHVLICMNYPENLPKQWNKYVFHLYHQRKDGSIEEIPVNCMANGIWCTATDFSPYVLCWDEAKIESAGTGESMVIINVMAILFFVSAMSMNLVLYRRRRLMRNL